MSKPKVGPPDGEKTVAINRKYGIDAYNASVNNGKEAAKVLQTPEHQEKMKAIRESPEFKTKLSNSQKARWERERAAKALLQPAEPVEKRPPGRPPKPEASAATTEPKKRGRPSKKLIDQTVEALISTSAGTSADVPGDAEQVTA